MIMFKAFIFDMDGVIVDNTSFQIQSWKKLLKKYAVNFEDEEILQQTLGRKAEEIIIHFFKTKEANIIEQLKEERFRIYKSLSKQKLELISGLINFLKLLKKNKKLVLLASSGSKKSVNFILSKFDLRKYFNIIITGESVIKAKPNPQIYLLASKKSGFEPKECVVFEDSPAGIKAAKKAGINCIGILTSYNKLEKTLFNIKNFTEIKKSILD